MMLTGWQGGVTVLMVVLGTMATRFTPFLLFPPGKPTPKYIQYLSQVLPYAAMSLLVVYCLKNVSLTIQPFGIPEAVGILVTAGMHLWRRNMLLSIGAGTAVYMLLIQAVFSSL